MKDPHFKIGNRVHVHGTPGTGTVVLIECIARRYVYHVRYTDANRISKTKAAQEIDIILIDSGEAQP